MSVLDVDNLMQEISPDAPCGPDVSYDPAFVEVLRLAEGTPEVQYGDVIKPAEEPNWHELRDRCVELLQRSRHLQLMVIATLASLRLEGVPGMAAGLGLLRETLERYWDSVHPQLDPDDNDPLERMNIVAALGVPPGTFGDKLRFRSRLLEAPLSNSRQLGRFSLRDIGIASGKIAVSNGEAQPAVTMSVIDAAFEDTGVDDLQMTAEAADKAAKDVRNLEQLLSARAPGGAPDLSGLRKDLEEICSCVQGYLSKRGYGTPEEGPGDGEAAPDGPGSENGRTGSVRVPVGDISSTQDVLLAIDRICQYYERVEPSSPVPLLLKRAKRLVSKSFLDIINDLSPSVVDDIKALGGIKDPPE